MQRIQQPVTADGVLLQRMPQTCQQRATRLRSGIESSSPPAAPSRLAAPRSTREAGSPEIIERIFDPYFTTKEFGEEVRGFGWATISQKIVHLHRGTISVESGPVPRTTVTVEIHEPGHGSSREPATTMTN